MSIAVHANDHQWAEIINSNDKIDYVRIDSFEGNFADQTDIFLLLKDEANNYNFTITEKPIIINSVVGTLKEMNVPPNVFRINGWPGFLSRQIWEISSYNNKNVEALGMALGKQMIIMPDEPGFVAARVIAMIINEAYFALEDNISTKLEIDIALKLGTNYPYGPFEWAELIGKNNICHLLQQLSLHDKKYLPSILLKEEAN